MYIRCALTAVAVLMTAAPALALPGETVEEAGARFASHRFVQPLRWPGDDDILSPLDPPDMLSDGEVGPAGVTLEVWLDGKRVKKEAVTYLHQKTEMQFRRSYRGSIEFLRV